MAQPSVAVRYSQGNKDIGAACHFLWYQEAESTKMAVRDWLYAKLGKELPQALAARRMIAQAVRMHGRRVEGGQLMVEVGDIVETTPDDSPYAVYRNQQRELTEVMWDKLKAVNEQNIREV